MTINVLDLGRCVMKVKTTARVIAINVLHGNHLD